MCCLLPEHDQAQHQATVFSHEGPARSLGKNGILAGYLALIAGYVNASGFVLLGTFTSHVTGNVGRLGQDIATDNGAAATLAGLMIVCFFVGAFTASILLEGTTDERISRDYGVALACEGLLLCGFVLVSRLSVSTHPRLLDAEASILCIAMGLQNSLVTRLSGAVIRTTHLTGVLTDLGIEAARWYRWYRAKVPVIPPSLLGSRRPPEHPKIERCYLLGTILLCFTMGGIAGALYTIQVEHFAMALPAFAIFIASAVAILGGRKKGRTG